MARPTAVFVSLALVTTLAASEVARGRYLSRHRPVAVEEALPVRPDSFYRVAWGPLRRPPKLLAGRSTRMWVTFRNVSSATWPDAQVAGRAGAPGAGAVRLGSRWLDADGDAVFSDYADRLDLPWPLEPGETICLPLYVEVPTEPGRYRLQIDLVHELVAWFEWRGADRLVVPLTVSRQ